MTLEAFQSIAVIGPRKMGKESICRLLGEKLSSSQETLRRYVVTVPDVPRLQKYVLTIYSKLDDFTLDLSERVGIIVLTPEKINSLCEGQRFKKHEQFFEILVKLSWLGVQRYVVVVTHMDRGGLNNMTWFQNKSREFTRVLRKDITIQVIASIPVGRKDRDQWYNILRSESWYDGPCLIQALNELVVSLPPKLSRSLWAVGQVTPITDSQHIRFATEAPCRGILTHGTSVQVFPESPTNSESLHGKLIVDTENLLISLQKGTLLETTAAVVASNSLAPQYPTVLKVDAILKKGLSPKELRHMDVDVVFFGPHLREGQIFTSNNPNTDLYHVSLHPNLANRSFLRLHMLRRPVVESFGKDPDSGRVLLFRRKRANTPRSLLAVGRVLSLFEYEIAHFVKLLMFIDQIQYTSSQERYSLARDLEHLIHDTKRDAIMLQLHPNNGAIDNTHRLEKFRKGFDHLISRLNSMRRQPCFRDYTHLIDTVSRCFEEICEKVIQAFAELSPRIEREVLDRKLREIARYYGDMKDTINRQTTHPIRKLIDEVIHTFEERRVDFLYKVHSQLSQYIDYYPKEPFSFYEEVHRGELSQSLEEAIRDGFEELLSNSLKYSEGIHKGEPPRIDIFIDPPSIDEPPGVKVWFQDSGLLTEQKLLMIRNSTRGWYDHKKHLDSYNVRFDVSERIGFGTTCVLNIPIWDIFPDMRQHILNVAAVLNTIDFEQQQYNGQCPDYLGQLNQAMDASNDIDQIVRAVETLVAEVHGTLHHLPSGPNWVKERLPQLERFGYVLRSQPQEYLEQMRKLLQRIQTHPVYHLLQDAQQSSRLLLQKRLQALLGASVQEDLFHLNQQKFPEYRLSHPALYRVLRKTLAWGLKEMIYDGQHCQPLHINCRMAESLMAVDVRFSRRYMFRTAQQLLPFRTRLANLGIKNRLIEAGTVQELTLSIPAWCITQ